jgi:hypothetical protein
MTNFISHSTPRRSTLSRTFPQQLTVISMFVLLTCSPLACEAAVARVIDVRQPPNVPLELKAIQQVVQRQQDVHQIQNMMSRRSFYHAAGQQAEELDFWSSRPDVSFGQNQGFRIGMTKIRAAYEVRYAKVRALELTRISKLKPEVKDVPANIGVGMLQEHTITTAIIEIAEDGKTAKGMWYTPGAVGGVKLHASWMWEKYAVDFIKENGKWKFWHVIVVTDFGVPFGKDVEGNVSDLSQQGVQGALREADLVPQIPRDVDRDIYKPLSSTTAPRLFPPMPVPYTTFAQTFSYGPDVPME